MFRSSASPDGFCFCGESRRSSQEHGEHRGASTAGSAPVLSVASWFVGGLATVTMVMIYVTEERKPLFNTPPGLCSVMAGWGLVFFGLVASLHFISGEASVRAHLSTMTAEHSTGDMDPLEIRIEKLRGRQEKLGTFIAELEGERETIVSRLRQTGREVKGDAQPVYAHELLDIDRSLKQLKERGPCPVIDDRKSRVAVAKDRPAKTAA